MIIFYKYFKLKSVIKYVIKIIFVGCYMKGKWGVYYFNYKLICFIIILIFGCFFWKFG